MKEAKEMMIMLPMVTATSWEELTKARTYPQSGRYIVKLDNGDIVVVDVALRLVEQGEERPIDEGTQSASVCFVGQPELLDPDDWVLAIDLENARMANEADREKHEEDMQEARDRHEAEMAEQKEKCEAKCQETEENCKKLIDEKEAEYHERYALLTKTKEQELETRRQELEHEYELKNIQLEHDVPKRFAQGEWVSGKTLTEIIKTLAAGKKEE